MNEDAASPVIAVNFQSYHWAIIKTILSGKLRWMSPSEI